MSLPALMRASLLVGAGALVGGGVWYGVQDEPAPGTAVAPAIVAASHAAKPAPAADPVPAQHAEAMQEAKRKLDAALRKTNAALSSPAQAEGGVSSIARSLPAPAAREEEDVMIRRAARAMGDGDVASARLLLTRAARSGDPRALFLLAQSYDPEALARRGLPARLGDAAKAAARYKEAAAKGYAPARPRVADLR